MAEKGITGPKNIIDGQTGIYNVYHHGAYDRETLLRNLGKTFEGANLTIKPYPCCRGTHPFIDAALILVKEYHIKPEQVQKVTITVGKGGMLLCAPLDVKCNPRTPVDCQFSIPWVVARAIAKGKVDIDNVTEEGIKDENIRKISSKITIEIDPDPIFHPLDPGRVEITTKEGTYKKRVDDPYGGPKNPMTFDDLVNKFYDCATHSGKHIQRKKLDKAVGLIKELETVDNVAEIMVQIG
jgi:2-methylcitrate dehydratase PrpD